MSEATGWPSRVITAVTRLCPEKLQDSVTHSPRLIWSGMAEKLLMAGGCGTGVLVGGTGVLVGGGCGVLVGCGTGVLVGCVDTTVIVCVAWLLPPGPVALSR